MLFVRTIRISRVVKKKEKRPSCAQNERKVNLFCLFTDFECSEKQRMRFQMLLPLYTAKKGEYAKHNRFCVAKGLILKNTDILSN